MLTDIRPLVERLMRQLVLAGVPVMAAACGGTPLPARGLDAGTGGVASGGTGSPATGGHPGTGGAAGASTPSGGHGGGGLGGTAGDRGTSGGGAGGTGLGAGPDGGVACQPLVTTCGTRSICPPIFPDGGAGGTLMLTTVTLPWNPDDPGWASLYQACAASGNGPAMACDSDCARFCKAVFSSGFSTPPYDRYFACTVTCGASPTITASAETWVCGRRSAGSRRRCIHAAGDPLGRYLSGAAELEAESVPAFTRLARGLRTHGAPDELVRAARSAATEEARHWRWTRALARRHEANPVPPHVPRAEFESLQALAEDNVIEGCVRETYGALVAAVQAETATDSEVRSLMGDIAVDELNHAALSWRIDAWATARLGAAFVARRRQVAAAATAELVGEVAAQAASPEAPLAEAGLPDPAMAAALLAAVGDGVWTHAFRGT